MSPKRVATALFSATTSVAVLGLWAVALAPVAALVPASLLDRGPGGATRLTPFPVALVAFDPSLWEGARNSLVMASMVTLSAWLVGEGFARALARWRFWGRRELSALALAAVVVPPGFAAVGLRGLGEGWDRTLLWFWVSFVHTTPVVALAAVSALARVAPSWGDAARLAGAGRGRTWRQAVRPTVRPEVARALAVVFTLTLVEPGAPLVLGLRRTLGFQIVEAALDRDRIGRASVLALLATLLAAVGRGLVVSRGGTVPPELSAAVSARKARASWGRAAVLGSALLLAAVVVWLPVAGLVVATFGSGPSRVSVSGFTSMARDPLLTRFVINSIALGLAAVVVDLILARGLAATHPGRFAALAGWPGAVPPLAIGVGALALPGLLVMAADGLAAPLGSRSPVVAALRTVADAIDPDRTTYVLCVLAVAAARLSLPARSALERVRSLRPVLLDAALTLGATPRRARGTIAGRWLGVAPGVAILTFTLAATNVTPALLLSPTADVRPIGPAVLVLADEPGSGLAHGSALALVAVAANLVALGVAASGKSRGALRGFRG